MNPELNRIQHTVHPGLVVVRQLCSEMISKFTRKNEAVCFLHSCLLDLLQTFVVAQTTVLEERGLTTPSGHFVH